MLRNQGNMGGALIVSPFRDAPVGVSPDWIAPMMADCSAFTNVFFVDLDP
jgi:hypothetical protein